MPEKNPDVWAAIWAWLINCWTLNSNQIGGFMAGLVVAYFRALLYGKDGTKTKRFAESVVCGVIAATSLPVLEKLGIGSEWLPFVGTAIGLLGLDFIVKQFRSVTNRWIDKKTEGNNNEQSD